MKNRRIIFKNIGGGTDKPLFSLKDLTFGILCESWESKSVYWYDNMGSIGKFYNLLGCQKKRIKSNRNRPK